MAYDGKMKKIWIKSDDGEMNIKADFSLKILLHGRALLRVAAADVFRVTVNGELVGYGPRRIVKGVSAINEYALDLKGGTLIKAEVVSYKNDGYYIAMQEPFFAAELIHDGRVVAGSEDFVAERDYGKLQKVLRYSLQRNFTESYVLPAVLKEEKTREVEGARLQECDLPYPDFARSDGKLIESGKIGILEKYEKFPLPFVFPLAKYMLKFDENELQTDAVDDISAIEYYRNDEIKDCEDHYHTFEFDYSMTGFISFKAQVYGDSEIFLVFDETLNEEHFRFSDEIYEKYYHDGALPVYWHRLNTVNIVKYKLCAGVYDLMTIEPYCLKFLRVIVKGKADISGVHIRRYENSDAFIKKADFPDKDLNELYVAAQRTFAQCSVDYLMDCPSRERAAWLCDSYFSAKAERLFTGNNRIEKNTLSAFLLMPEDNSIPKYMIPMCYHINPLQKEYMPTWAGWFVIELHDYLLRTGDKEFTDKFKEKVCGLIDGYFGKYLNEYGLLENLGGFVFIEWSKANDFTKGVSFCANMVFYRALLAAYGLYGDEKYKAQAEKVKDAVIKLSYNGEFFVDNALRENGKLQRTENVSETCQYYAFHCGIADEKTFPELYEKLLSDFGKKRDDTKVYPQVHRSNAFIGDMLRLDYLAEHGRAEQALEESKNYYLNMVKRTGTLWEHDSPIGSLVHCFSALVAVWIEKFYINHNIK